MTFTLEQQEITTDMAQVVNSRHITHTTQRDIRKAVITLRPLPSILFELVHMSIYERWGTQQPVLHKAY
jgi:hypothetical protein